MRKLKKATKADVATIVTLMQADLASYAQLTKTAYADKIANDTYITELHYDDIVYNYNALLQFMQDKDTVQLCNKLIKQDTAVREFFYKTIFYATDNNLYD
jgi:hypothetical protein